MNARSLTRQSSIGTIKSKSIINEKFSYLKPIRANVSLLRSVITNKKIKISSCNASKILKTSEEAETDFKTKSLNVSPALNENSIETHLNFIEYLSTQSLNQKLEEKLKEIDKQDYKSIFNAYFAIFDLVIVADKNFGLVSLKSSNKASGFFLFLEGADFLVFKYLGSWMFLVLSKESTKFRLTLGRSFKISVIFCFV